MFVRNNVKINNTPSIVHLNSPEILEKAIDYLNIYDGSSSGKTIDGESFIGLPLRNFDENGGDSYLMMPWPWTRAHLGYIDGIMLPEKAIT